MVSDRKNTNTEQTGLNKQQQKRLREHYVFGTAAYTELQRLLLLLGNKINKYFERRRDKKEREREREKKKKRKKKSDIRNFKQL